MLSAERISWRHVGVALLAALLVDLLIDLLVDLLVDQVGGARRAALVLDPLGGERHNVLDGDDFKQSINLSHTEARAPIQGVGCVLGTILPSILIGFTLHVVSVGQPDSGHVSPRMYRVPHLRLLWTRKLFVQQIIPCVGVVVTLLTV